MVRDQPPVLSQQRRGGDKERGPRDAPQQLARSAKNSRSDDRNAGRATCRRRTVSSCRSTTISSSLNAADRNRRQTSWRTC